MVGARAPPAIPAHLSCSLATDDGRPRNRHRVHPSRVHSRCSWLTGLRDRSPVVCGLVVGADRAWHQSLCLKLLVVIPEVGEGHSRTSGCPLSAFGEDPSTETWLVRARHAHHHGKCFGNRVGCPKAGAGLQFCSAVGSRLPPGSFQVWEGLRLRPVSWSMSKAVPFLSM
jgi:hypothetical protein